MHPPPANGPGNGYYRAVVFDFDGTLASLTLDFELMRKRVAEAVAAYFEKAPQPPSSPLLEWVESLTSGLAGTHGVQAGEQLREAAHAAIRQMEVEAAQQGELFGFTRPLLTALRSAGVGVGIITRNCSPALQAAFPDAREHADVILTRDETTRVKPDPAHLGAALEYLLCPPNEALIVGDHPLDMETGRLMGTHSAGVGSGRISMEALAEAGAHHVAQDSLALCRQLSQDGLLPPLRGV